MMFCLNLYVKYFIKIWKLNSNLNLSVDISFILGYISNSRLFNPLNNITQFLGIVRRIL